MLRSEGSAIGPEETGMGDDPAAFAAAIGSFLGRSPAS